MARKPSKLLAKTAVFGLEQFASMADTFRLPRMRDEQDKMVTRTYRTANKVALASGLPPKVYRRLKQKGVVEEIR